MIAVSNRSRNYFVPVVDFGLFAFGFDIFIDGSGFRRKHLEMAEKASDDISLAEAPLPSALSLEDKILPKDLSQLEKASFFSYQNESPRAASYIFLAQPSAQPDSAFLKYLVYKPTEFPHKVPNAVPYAVAFFDYNAEEEYAPTQQQYNAYGKPAASTHPSPIEYPKQLYSAMQRHEPLPLTYSYHQSAAFNRSESLLAAQPENTTQIVKIASQPKLEKIVSSAPLQPSSAIQLAHEILPALLLLNPVKPTEKTASQLDLRLQLHTPKVVIYTQERNPYQNQRAKASYASSANSQNYSSIKPKALASPSAPVRNYDTQQRIVNVMNSHFWRNSGFYLGTLLTGKKSGSSQPINHAKHSLPKIKSAKNYDSDPDEFNIMGSGFWIDSRHYLGIVTNIKDRDYEQVKKPVYKTRTIEQNNEEQPKTIYEREAELQQEKEKSNEPNQKYQAKEIKDEEGRKNDGTEKIKEKHRHETQIDNTDKKPSVLEYAATIAGGGIVLGAAGLFSLVSLPVKAISKISDVYREIKPNSIDTTINNSAPAAITDNKTIIFTQKFKYDIESIIRRTGQLGYGNVSISIRNNLTGEYYGCNDKKQKPQPSHAKVAIAFAAAYLAQKGLLDLKNKKIDFDPGSPIDKELILKRETDEDENGKIDYPEFRTKTQFDYDFLQKLMIRDSSNTATNLILKFIGNGDVYHGMSRVNEVMEKVGLGDIVVREPYNRIFDYTKNVATTEAIERLMGYILKGKYLKPEYLSPIREDLENERWMKAFIDKKLPGVKSGTKVHIHKHGTGFAAYLGDYTVAVSFDDSKTELYSDKATSAKHLREELSKSEIDAIKANGTKEAGERAVNPIFFESSRKFEEMFKLFGQYLFNLTYTTKPKPSLITPAQPANPLY